MSVRRVLCVLVIIACYRNISAVGIGERCNRTVDCFPQYETLCKSGLCSCLEGYVPKADSSGCNPTVKHGGKCEESVQCNYSNETVCQRGTCQCKTRFSYNGERCVGNITLGEVCDHDTECVAAHDLKQETVWCFNKQCSCKRGFKREEDRCVIGGDCTADSDCADLGNSMCNLLMRDRANCACTDGFIPVGNNTWCFPVVHELGTGCEYDEQCSYKLGQAVCIRHQCQCAVGASLTKDKTCSAAVSSVISLSCFLLIWLVKVIS